MSFKHDDSLECPSCFNKLLSADERLREWFWVQKKKFPSMHVACAYRNKEAQNIAFTQGDSKLPWPQSKHNLMPAKALDIFQQVEGRAIFDPIFCAKLNAESRLADFPLRWGGEFKSLGDSGHFELKE